MLKRILKKVKLFFNEKVKTKMRWIYHRIVKNEKMIAIVLGTFIFALAVGAGGVATYWRFSSDDAGKDVKTNKIERSFKPVKNDLPSPVGKNKTAAPSGNVAKGNSDADKLIGCGYEGLNMRKNIFVVLAIKSILLIVLIAVMVVIGTKIFKNYKKAKKSSHSVKQLAKTRRKAVKVKKVARKARKK